MLTQRVLPFWAAGHEDVAAAEASLTTAIEQALSLSLATRLHALLKGLRS